MTSNLRPPDPVIDKANKKKKKEYHSFRMTACLDNTPAFFYPLLHVC